jgi:3-deoxy-D-manno-octulosonic-acid transferase
MIQSEEPSVPVPTAIDALPTANGAPVRRTANLFRDPSLLLWNAFLIAASPLLIALKVRRFQRKRNEHELNRVRWTLAHESAHVPSRTPGRTRIAFAVASFGEILLVDPLTRQLRAERPDVEVVWVVRDSHTLEELRQGRPDQPTVIWPFDALPPVNRFFHLVDPDLVVFAERYSFPTLLAGTRAWGSKALLINGRVKADKGPMRRLIRSYDRWLFGLFEEMLFQTEIYAKRARAKTKTRVTALGNLKLDLPRRTLSPDQAAELHTWLGPASDLPLLVAGSTDNLAEERFVLEAFREVRKVTPCRLLLAPRKPGRLPEVLRLIEELGLSASLRTRRDTPKDVMILDTMGELAFAYGYGIAAYVGGAFNGMGHNIVEPLEFGIPVSYGPQRGHFEELQRLCEGAGVGFRIHKSRELAAHWIKTIRDAGFRQTTSEKTRHLLEAQQGSMQETYDVILAAISSRR